MIHSPWHRIHIICNAIAIRVRICRIASHLEVLHPLCFAISDISVINIVNNAGFLKIGKTVSVRVRFVDICIYNLTIGKLHSCGFIDVIKTVAICISGARLV